MHYFLLGPSGVGKTCFGNWLQAHRQYHHIPADRGDQSSGLKAEGLFESWKKLRRDRCSEPATFARELQDRAKGKKGCVITFWSIIFHPPDEIGRLAEHDIGVKYLYGPKELCIKAFVDREHREGHPDRERAFWCKNNTKYEKMGGPELARYRADIIKSSGERLTENEIVELLKIE